MNPRRTAEILLIGAAVAAAGAWLWRCLCLFPIHGWNEIRLMPSVMWAHGLSPYPTPGAGPASTWIYGPVPLLLNLPAALAGHAATALLAAGVINLLVPVFALAVVCATWPMPDGRRHPGPRVVAAVVCLALWPATSFEFLQPDNAGVALGLLSLAALQRASGNRGRWLAAIACAGAVACKQTLLGLAAAQCVYLAVEHDRRAGIVHGLRLAALGLAAGAVTLWAFGVPGVMLHVVSLPAALPWAASLAGRLRDFGWYLGIQGGLPLMLVLLPGRRIWHRGSPWLLPALAWATAWPLDLVSLLKTGGSINSLHGALFFLPPAAMLLITQAPVMRWRNGLAAMAVGTLVARLALASPGIWRPLTAPLRQGEALARSLPGEVYFPWHPLVSYFAGGRFYHTEDGLFTRWLAGRPVVVTRDSPDLPPRMHVIAYLRGEPDWGIARSMIPPGAQQSTFGAWDLYSWVNPATAPSSPAQDHK